MRYRRIGSRVLAQDRDQNPVGKSPHRLEHSSFADIRGPHIRKPGKGTAVARWYSTLASSRASTSRASAMERSRRKSAIGRVLPFPSSTTIISSLAAVPHIPAVRAATDRRPLDSRPSAESSTIGKSSTHSGHQRLHKAVVPIPKSSPPFRIDRIGYPLKL